jgi:GNAT superfamily N-acetyltransferase
VIAAAAARNHTAWMRARALATGGAIRRHGHLRWYAEGLGGEISLGFPKAVSQPALSAALADARACRSRSIACWATGLEDVDALWARLEPAGFEWGWKPHWMALDPAGLPAAEPDPRVSLVTSVREYDAYGSALLTLTRGRCWHAEARVDGRHVGHAWSFLHGDEAGVYDMDVYPPWQRQGLGRALTLAVCGAARDAGARLITLNATDAGERLYSTVGFEPAGWGQTWWWHNRGQQRQSR